MATFVEKLVDHTVNVITNEGRNFIGNLRSFDQKMNIILANCVERRYQLNEPVQSDDMGLYFIRGDNIAVIGEIDMNLEAQINYDTIKAPSLKPMLLH